MYGVIWTQWWTYCLFTTTISVAIRIKISLQTVYAVWLKFPDYSLGAPSYECCTYHDDISDSCLSRCLADPRCESVEDVTSGAMFCYASARRWQVASRDKTPGTHHYECYSGLEVARMTTILVDTDDTPCSREETSQDDDVIVVLDRTTELTLMDNDVTTCMTASLEGRRMFRVVTYVYVPVTVEGLRLHLLMTGVECADPSLVP